MWKRIYTVDDGARNTRERRSLFCIWEGRYPVFLVGIFGEDGSDIPVGEGFIGLLVRVWRSFLLTLVFS